MFKFKPVLTIFLVASLGIVIVDGMIEVSFWIYVILVSSFISLMALGAFNLSAGFFTPVKFKGEGDGNTIAITFDDGPIPGKTEIVLDILKKHNVLASFFLIGKRVESDGEIVKRILNEGHIVGNHTYSHAATFDFKSSRQMAEEMRKTDELLFKQLGKKPRFFRPPYGVTNPSLAAAIRRRDYVTIGWSIRSLDTVLSQEKVFNRIKHVKGGDIVLFHDYSDSTLALLDSFLVYGKEKGLEFVSVDKLVNEKAYR